MVCISIVLSEKNVSRETKKRETIYQNKLELYCALLDRDAERAQAFTVDMLDSVANGAFSLYSDAQQQ